MGYIDRNSGSFASTTAFSVTRSTGSYGTGTVIVVVVFGNTVVTTPGSATSRGNSVVDLGLYAYDFAGAGQSSIAFTCSTGSGTWWAWELSAGSTFVATGSLTQTSAGNTTYATGTVTPTAGARHLLAVVGGVGGGGARTVTGFDSSFTKWATNGDRQATVQDWPFAGAADLDVTANGSTAYSTTATFSGATATARGAILLPYINAAGGADTTPPTVPTGLAVNAVGSTTADVSWTASTDAVGVTGYQIEITGP